MDAALKSGKSNDTGTALFAILPLGPVDPMALSVVAANLQTVLGLNTDIIAEIALPLQTYLPGRGQYDADKILAHLESLSGGPPYRLAVTHEDICTPILTYVFGESQLGGHTALISMHRLTDKDPHRIYQRGAKIGCHEAGHLLGIGHCRAPDCLMRFASNLENLDRLPLALCSACAFDLGPPIAADR